MPCAVYQTLQKGDPQKDRPHYPPQEQEAVWERVQLQYAAFLSDWRTDLVGKK